jgi:peptidoglycan LD-endopeptidase LytH
MVAPACEIYSRLRRETPVGSAKKRVGGLKTWSKACQTLTPNTMVFPPQPRSSRLARRSLIISWSVWLAGAALVGAASPPTPPLLFPTPNRTLVESGGQERFYVGTSGRPWTSGTFGCVRTEGWQMHEGIDIVCLERDRAGEPVDPVFATAVGVVAYINGGAALSNYGIYVVLQHRLNGLEVYSLYAHLGSVREGLAPGQPLRAGEVFATVGRTANTREVISKERAHLHFELNLLINEHYAEWHRTRGPGSRNDHGLWNGLNLLGMDPSLLLLSSHRFPTNFNLPRYLRSQKELCRIAVRATDFPWLQRYAMLVQPAPDVPSEAVAGYELHLDYTGIPVRVFPRTEAQLTSSQRYTLLEVNEELYRQNPCRRIVVRKGNRFEIGSAGTQFLDLLTFTPPR